METVRCYLCDHEFVEGEEPWLMFEHRLREDGQVDCSLAELLGSILNKQLDETLAHSALLCDSCNADVLEYESLEKQFSQIRERILSSYKENSTIQNINNLLRTAINNETMPHHLDANSLLIPQEIDNLSNSEYISIADMDLVEEIQDEEVDLQGNDEICVIANETLSMHSANDFIKNKSEEIITDNFDFAAFNEHVAQNSLPSGVLNMSDGLVNLEVSEKSIEVENIPMREQDVIVYDAIEQSDLIVQQDDCEDMQSYGNSTDDELKYIINAEIFKDKNNSDEDSQNSTAAADNELGNNETEHVKPALETAKAAPEPVCKKDGEFYVCLLCEISSQFERQALIEHFEEVHTTKFHMCEQCQIGFARRQDLRIHNEIGHVIECELCDKTFTNARIYRIHKRAHYGSAKTFECPVCQKMYISKAILDEHMNTHTGVRPFQCSECPKDFASKYTLVTHMKIHRERPRPFQCDQCDKRFLNLQNLNQHKKLHVSVKEFQCEVCQKAFTTQHSLQVHKVVHSGQRPFICRICGKSFARRPEIKDHERIHTGERPFKCDFCPMAFAQRTNLATHRKSTHLNEKLHKCDICLRSFKRKRLLDYHIQAIHTGERPHKCEICGAGFVYPEHFKKHMLIHTGKKPYACEVCGKQFNSRDNRNAHRFVHSDKKPYECMECGAGFMRKPLLLTHMKQSKHINDTIIINQPQFTQHQTIETIETGNNFTVTSSEFFNTLDEDESGLDVDNDLQTQEVCDETIANIVYKDGNFLTRNVPSTSLCEKDLNDDENVMAVVSEHFIKDELNDVKYLEFEDLDRGGHQVLTWVGIAGDDKV